MIKMTIDTVVEMKHAMFQFALFSCTVSVKNGFARCGFYSRAASIQANSVSKTGAYF